MARSVLPSCVVVCCVLATLTADPALAAESPVSTRSADDELIVIRPAPDSLSGHFLLAPRVGYTWAGGELESGLSQADMAGAGPTVGMDVSYGLSRYVAIRLGGDYAFLSPSTVPTRADATSASSLLVRLGLVYHVVDGTSVDPWIGASTGIRVTSVDYTPVGADKTTDLDYSGIEWLRVSMGLTWFGLDSFGVGPYVSGDLGAYSRRPGTDTPRPGEYEDKTSSFFIFSTGLRFVFDPSR